MDFFLYNHLVIIHTFSIKHWSWIELQYYQKLNQNAELSVRESATETLTSIPNYGSKHAKNN